MKVSCASMRSVRQPMSQMRFSCRIAAVEARDLLEGIAGLVTTQGAQRERVRHRRRHLDLDESEGAPPQRREGAQRAVRRGRCRRSRAAARSSDQVAIGLLARLVVQRFAIVELDDCAPLPPATSSSGYADTIASRRSSSLACEFAGTSRFARETPASGSCCAPRRPASAGEKICAGSGSSTRVRAAAAARARHRVLPAAARRPCESQSALRHRCSRGRGDVVLPGDLLACRSPAE